MAFTRLVSVLLLIHNTGGLLGAEVRSSIVGGHDAETDSWPWMVYLNITSEEGDRWRCGGTLLTTDWVLTAANCWERYPRPNLRRSMVWVGVKENLLKGAVFYKGVIHAIPHPEYRNLSTGYINDIAMVKLKTKVKFSPRVAAVKLPNAEDKFDSTSECWITGWGNTGTNAPLRTPENLQELKIPILSQSVCQASYPQLNSNMLCAGDMAGGKDACEGDYGGPLMCRAAGGFVQVGIMSYGSPDGCGLPGRPGIYTQVSKYLTFINDYIHRD